MANRSYLYSLSNRPTTYEDRPESICGLSEWPYYVPFIYRLLLSGDPQLCASLIADGFEEDEPEHKSRVYAISSPFDPGFERVRRFADIIRTAVSLPPSIEPQASAVQPKGTFLGRLKQLFSAKQETAPAASPAQTATVAELLAALDESIVFLEAHRDRYLLLETIELDSMLVSGEAALKDSVEQEIARCRYIGRTVDALPSDLVQAGQVLRRAATQKSAPPLDALFGLHLDDDYDSTYNDATQYPLGLEWSEDLYFELLNLSEFQAQDA